MCLGADRENLLSNNLRRERSFSQDLLRRCLPVSGSVILVPFPFEIEEKVRALLKEIG